MSDQERNHSAHSDALGDIDWTHYGRQAQSIREGVSQETEPQDSDWQQPAPEEPAAETEEEESETEAAEVYSEAEAEEYAEEVYDGETYAEDQLTEEEARQAYEEDYPPRRRPLVPPEPPQPPEQSRPVQKKRRRARSVGVTFLVALLYVVSVLSIAFVTATLGWKWANDLLALNKEEHTASVTIQAGDGVDEVAQKLKDNGLIEYPFLFEVFAGFTNKAERISSGTYELNTEMDYRALILGMHNSSGNLTAETVTVTIPEGYTVRQTIRLLAEKGVNTEENLLEAARTATYDYSFINNNSEDPSRLEGYLFPDTYEFYKNHNAKNALGKLIDAFADRIDEDAFASSKAKSMGYSMKDVVIIASLIEKETDGTDQRDIASVIYNRLQKPGETAGLLQIDASLLYGLPDHTGAITNADKTVDTPYNLYLHKGLPPTAIANPGSAALKAAMDPNDTDYYYYALGTDGKHHFSKTLSEHNAFVGSSSYGG